MAGNLPPVLPSIQEEDYVPWLRMLMGWGSPEFDGRVRVSATPPVLEEDEAVIFVGYLTAGLGFPVSEFLASLLAVYGLQLQHLSPNSVLQMAAFVHLCEGFVGVPPSVELFRHFYQLQSSSSERGGEIGRYHFQVRTSARGSFPARFNTGKWDDWRRRWVVIRVGRHECLRLPEHRPSTEPNVWNQVRELPAAWGPVLQRLKALTAAGLTMLHVVADFLRA